MPIEVVSRQVPAAAGHGCPCPMQRLQNMAGVNLEIVESRSGEQQCQRRRDARDGIGRSAWSPRTCRRPAGRPGIGAASSGSSRE